jgi:uncharacterized protein (TIGR02284 family)
MTERLDALTSLHTALIDSGKGYQAALENADGKGLGPLFRDMITLRGAHADEVSGILTRQGHKPSEDGSFMATVHWAVINVRALVTGLDESILPGLIDGEKRIVGYYDEAIEAAAGDTDIVPVLERQRGQVRAKIAEMQTRADRAA